MYYLHIYYKVRPKDPNSEIILSFVSWETVRREIDKYEEMLIQGYIVSLRAEYNRIY